MVGFDRKAGLNAFIAAAQGLRVLLYPGWPGTPNDMKLPDNFFIIEEKPHQWLFPRT